MSRIVFINNQKNCTELFDFICVSNSGETKLKDKLRFKTHLTQSKHLIPNSTICRKTFTPRCLTIKRKYLQAENKQGTTKNFPPIAIQLVV